MPKKRKVSLNLNKKEEAYLKGVVGSQFEKLSFYQRENKFAAPLKQEFKIVSSLKNKFSV